MKNQVDEVFEKWWDRQVTSGRCEEIEREFLDSHITEMEKWMNETYHDELVEVEKEIEDEEKPAPKVRI